MGAWLYILHCADGSFYTGTTRADLEKRIAEHQAGAFDGYTAITPAGRSGFLGIL